MDDFEELLNDLDKTVAEDVDWGDEDDIDGAGDVIAAKKSVAVSLEEAELFAAVNAVNQQPAKPAEDEQLDFNSVNAVAKSEVSEAVARSFEITRGTAGGTVPTLVSGGIKSDNGRIHLFSVLCAYAC